MKCIYCEKEFEIKPICKAGGSNRVLCYECLPEGCSKEERHNVAQFLLTKRIQKEKMEIGCSKCGYNKCGRALEWHHINDDKEYNASRLLSKCSRESLDLYYKEISKCILLCSNCHRELHEENEGRLRELKFQNLHGSNEYEMLRQKIKDVYLDTKSLITTSKILNKDIGSIKSVLKYYNIPINRYNSVKVQMLDKDTLEFIREFESAADASRYLGKGKVGNSHIISACKGERKTAFGYKWRYVEDECISDEFENKAI